MVKSIDEAVAMVEAICHLPGNRTAIRRYERWIRASGLGPAIIAHDTPFLYDWLMEGFSFQGISDANALGYIELHGNAEWVAIERHLREHPPACSKLKAFEAFKRCGYRKSTRSCNVPDLIETCLVPRLPLRKGDLNQLALSLFLFLRDVCEGDLVGFIRDDSGVFIDTGRQHLIKAFRPIFGTGPKLISMSLASILIAGGRHRPNWVKVGRSMVVIETLIHNFLHRSGILGVHGNPHLYGPRCYGPKGCEDVLRDIAAKIDLKAIDRSLSSHHPRLVQAALWWFCAEGELDICNGRKIDDRRPCRVDDCPVGDHCSRTVLFPEKPGAAAPKPTEETGEQPSSSEPAQDDWQGKSRGLGRSRQNPKALKALIRNPRLQGDRDGMCGFYAVINALRLALHPLGGLSYAKEREIWASLIKHADREWKFRKLYVEGITVKQLFSLARHGAKMATKLTGTKVIFRPSHSDTGRRSSLKASIAKLLDQGHGAIIIGLENSWMSHWSVVRGMSNTSLWLHDSDGGSRIRIDSCELSVGHKPGQTSRYRIKIYGSMNAANTKNRSSSSPNALLSKADERRVSLFNSRFAIIEVAMLMDRVRGVAASK